MLTERMMNAPRAHAPAFRRIRYAARYLRAFLLAIVANPGVILRRTGRTIIWGKIRRTTIGWVPGLALHLKRKHGLTGGCTSCGASCNLLFRCPHWDAESRLCSIYEDRPIVCRLFPITPSDLRDRDLAAGGKSCGYSFDPEGTQPARTPPAEDAGSGFLRIRSLRPFQGAIREPRETIPGERRSSRGE